MSNIKQETIFVNAGLNSDDEQRFIPIGDSPYRLNVMVGSDNAVGVLVNLKGTEQTIDLSDHQLNKSLTYVTIGAYYNRLTRKCYYIVFTQPYDSGGSVYIYDNKIFCYNEDLKTLDLIFTDTANWLGLELSYPLRDMTMLGDWLYINPRTSEPKVIDVTRAYNYTNFNTYDGGAGYVYGDKVTYQGGLFLATATIASGIPPAVDTVKWQRIGDSYRSETEIAFDSEFEYAFDVLKMPPTVRPTISYGSDTSIQTNNVRGKVFRFSYRYKYFDNSYSCYSAYSDVTLPEDDEVYNGEVLNDITTNNYIKVSVYPHSPALVKEIEVVIQEITGDWKRVKVINRQEQSQIDTFDVSFNFYNNESYIVEDNTQVARIIDYVPKKANSQEIINKNILCYGGCLEGFDNIPKEDIQVHLTPELESISTIPTIGTIRRDNVNNVPSDVSIDTNFLPSEFVKKINIGGWALGSVIAGDMYVVTIDGVTLYHMLGAGAVDTKAHLVAEITSFLTDKFPRYAVSNRSGADYVSLTSPDTHFADITQSLFSSAGATSAQLSKKKGFKDGANHPFCLFYYDDSMRRWDAQTSKTNEIVFGLEMAGTTVYVPMFNEYSPLPSDTANRWKINWEISHTPPTGAKYWKWGYAGNSQTNKFVQYIISSIANSDPDQCKIDLTPLQTLKSTTTATWNQFPNSVIDTYTFTVGDRIRFITKAVAPSAGTSLGALVDGVYEFEILSQDATDSQYIFIQRFNFGAATIGENTLVEIYSPLKSISETKTEYFEFGDLMPVILDSGGVYVHGGQTQDQDTALSQTAKGVFDEGDVYHIGRTPSKPLDTTTTWKGAFHESMGYSDFYISNDWDRGKIGFETTFGERFLNIIKYSRPYFQNTEINGLPTFEEDDANGWPGFKELNDVFGNIVAIYEQGDTLKVYQERKASSILVGRTEYLDSTGNATVATSNVVLGTIRYSPSNYSTVFPESIARNNKFLYGFDIYNGVVWRDSVNGLFPISGRYAEAGGDADYKMQTYFKLKAKALMESGIDHVDVLGAWDEEYKCLYLTFKDYVIGDNDETIVFHEPTNRWITFVEFNQTPTGGYNVPLELTYDIVKGFEGGIGYSFDEATRFAIFNIGNGSGTSNLVRIYPPEILLTFTLYPPTIVTLQDPVTTPATNVTVVGFTANWSIASGATGFYLDVATDYAFTSMVAGYDNLSVGGLVTWPVTGLDGRTAYYYRVRAVLGSITSGDSDIRTVNPVLSAPVTIASSNIDSTSFTANWNNGTIATPVLGATGYKLDVATDELFANKVIGTGGKNYNDMDVHSVLTYSITGLTDGVFYYFRLRAYNLFQTSASSISGTTLTDTPPATPSGFRVTAVTYNSITLDWNAVNFGSDPQVTAGYNIEIATNALFTTNYQLFSLSAYFLYNPPSYTSYKVMGLTEETLYFCRISSRKGIQGGHISAPSSAITATTLMSNITLLAITDYYSQGCTVNWMTKASAINYYLDLATTYTFNAGTFILHDQPTGNTNHYVVTGLTANASYYFRIRGYDGTVYSDYSVPYSYNTGSAPVAPTGLSVSSVTNSGFTMNWYGNGGPNYELTVVGVGGYPKTVVGISDTVTGLNGLTAYTWKIRSFDNYGLYSAYSPDVVTTTLGLVPDIPVATAVSNVGTNGFRANWNASGGTYPATGYKLYISQDPSCNAPYTAGFDGLDVGNVTYYDVTGLLPNHGYFYKLVAYNGAGSSSASIVITAYTNALPLPTISLSPSSWNFGGDNINKVITITIGNATSWGINFPSLNGRIHEYTRDATTSTLYYSGPMNSGDSVSFYATGTGGTTTTDFQGRWT